MTIALELLLLITLPATLFCALLFWMGAKASSAPVGRALKWLSALAWVWWLALSALLITAATTCEPRFLFRYGNCTVISDGLASASFEVFVASIISSAVLAGALLLTFGVSEWRARRRTQRNS